MQQQQNDVEMTAVKALAAASKTPFLTAFKVTLGIAAAQLVVLACFGVAACIGISGLYLLLR